MRLLSFLFILLPTLAFAQTGVEVRDAWAPASLNQPNGVGFLTLTAHSDDALIDVTSDCCDAVETHSMTMDGDVMRMRRVDAIALPAHQDVQLKSGGYHLMLIGLKKSLEEGDKVTVTLEFEHADSVKTELQVKPRHSATVHGDEHGGHH